MRLPPPGLLWCWISPSHSPPSHPFLSPRSGSGSISALEIVAAPCPGLFPACTKHHALGLAALGCFLPKIHPPADPAGPSWPCLGARGHRGPRRVPLWDSGVVTPQRGGMWWQGQVVGTPIQAPTSSRAGQDLSQTTTNSWPNPIPCFPLRWGGSAGGQAARKCEYPRACSHTARLLGSLNAKGQIYIIYCLHPECRGRLCPGGDQDSSAASPWMGTRVLTPPGAPLPPSTAPLRVPVLLKLPPSTHVFHRLLPAKEKPKRKTKASLGINLFAVRGDCDINPRKVFFFFHFEWSLGVKCSGILGTFKNSVHKRLEKKPWHAAM